MTNLKMADIENPSLALCLSGGGLRATFFHLGVIKGLRKTTIGDTSALSKVKEIYSVSGGSIFAAHLIKNWDKYCGTDSEFEEAAHDLLRVAKRDLRGRVIRRWLLSVVAVFPRILGWGRTYWLAKEYEHLFGSSNLADFYKPNVSPERPVLHILATSFMTGELCSFSPNDFEITRRSGNETTPVNVPADMLPLSYAVAASSAFPPLFPPLKLSSEMLGSPEEEDFHNPIYLSDGGVFDNLGFEKFYCSNPGNRQGANAVLLSNAGSSFRSDINSSFSGVISRNVRASDIMMRRVAESTDERTSQMPGIAVIDVRIGKTVEHDLIPVTIQQRLRNVRTDLDQFSPTLVELLVDHGFRVSRQALKDHGCELSDPASKQTAKEVDHNFLDREALAAANRSFWLVNFRDWTTYVLIVILASAIALVGMTVWGAWDTVNAKLAEKDALEQKTKALEEKQVADAQKREALEEKQAADAERTEALKKENEALKNQNEASEQYKRIADELTAKYNTLLKQMPTAQLPTPPSKDKNYNVWIQFAGSINREEMKTFANQIKKQWENTLGAEQGGERTQNAAGFNEVRYGKGDEKAAERLTQDVLATGLIKSMGKPRFYSQIPPGSLEIWVSR